MNTVRTIALALTSCIPVLLQCSNLMGGAGGETTNGFVQGRLMQSDGIYAADTRVSLVPALYNPVKDPPIAGTMIDTTDETGLYTLQTAQPGTYNIEAINLVSHTSKLVTGIIVTANDTLHRIRDTLKISGLLNVIMTGQNNTGSVYITGTTFQTTIRNNTAIFDGVPAGDIPSVYYYNAADSAQNHLIKAGITVKSGQTVTIADLTNWEYSRKFYLNTTDSGADISGTVTDFPVLVRLTSDNFNFSQAAADGKDIRFTKLDNTPLAYEIERWDGAAQLAEVWVRLDTIYGNNGSQYILMLWGNPNAIAGSNGTAVFDTSRGFQGVWHLNDSGDVPAVDATANRYDGTPHGMVAAYASTGRIGRCRRFNGDSSSLIMEGTADSKLNFPEGGSYTLSAWVWADTSDVSRPYAIVSKGDRQYDLLQWPSSPNEWMFSEWGQKGREVVNSPLNAKDWTHVTGVRSGTRLLLYVNGLCVNDTLFVKEPPDSLNTRYTGFDFMVGRIASNSKPDAPYFFTGRIDEVRACNVARSADWVKLSYMNQHINNKLVEARQQQ